MVRFAVNIDWTGVGLLNSSKLDSFSLGTCPQDVSIFSGVSENCAYRMSAKLFYHILEKKFCLRFVYPQVSVLARGQNTHQDRLFHVDVFLKRLLWHILLYCGKAGFTGSHSHCGRATLQGAAGIAFSWLTSRCRNTLFLVNLKKKAQSFIFFTRKTASRTYRCNMVPTGSLYWHFVLHRRKEHPALFVFHAPLLQRASWGAEKLFVDLGIY